MRGSRPSGPPTCHYGWRRHNARRRTHGCRRSGLRLASTGDCPETTPHLLAERHRRLARNPRRRNDFCRSPTHALPYFAIMKILNSLLCLSVYASTNVIFCASGLTVYIIYERGSSFTYLSHMTFRLKPATSLQTAFTDRITALFIEFIKLTSFLF